jgi:hypothetical protein
MQSLSFEIPNKRRDLVRADLYQPVAPEPGEEDEIQGRSVVGGGPRPQLRLLVLEPELGDVGEAFAEEPLAAPETSRRARHGVASLRRSYRVFAALPPATAGRRYVRCATVPGATIVASSSTVSHGRRRWIIR